MRQLLFVLMLLSQGVAMAMVENKPATSDEACEAALEKKATYNYLVAKLGRDETVNVDAVLTEIKRTSLDYKDLNAYCKR